MKVVYIGTHKGDIKCREVKGTLKEWQEMVGGYIQITAIPQLVDMGLEMLVNEEGVLANLELNENLYPFFFVGPAVIVAVRKDEFTGLSDAQICYVGGFLRGLAK